MDFRAASPCLAGERSALKSWPCLKPALKFLFCSGKRCGPDSMALECDTPITISARHYATEARFPPEKNLPGFRHAIPSCLVPASMARHSAFPGSGGAKHANSLLSAKSSWLGRGKFPAPACGPAVKRRLPWFFRRPRAKKSRNSLLAGNFSLFSRRLAPLSAAATCCRHRRCRAEISGQ